MIERICWTNRKLGTEVGDGTLVQVRTTSVYTESTGPVESVVGPLTRTSGLLTGVFRSNLTTGCLCVRRFITKTNFTDSKFHPYLSTI